MLRTYKPLAAHNIFIYQQHVEYLVFNVWCKARKDINCQELLTKEFEEIYLKRNWIKEGVDEIYDICQYLNDVERATIKEAFIVNNAIDLLSEGAYKPIELGKLPDLVANKMKPLLIKFYSDLISAREKLSYYNDLIIQNGDFKFCLCCGLSPIESAESHYREDNDHYLPKAEYPFASVNFKNLLPLCSKCNKKCKSTKNPFDNGRKSFYAFKPLENEFEIEVSIDPTDSKSYLALKDEEVTLTYNNDPEKVDTWHWLFKINTRYKEEIRQFSKTELRMLANRFKRNEDRKKGESYEQILNDAIEDYEFDKYDDRKFLKRGFLKEMLNKRDWMDVYDQLLALE